MEEGDVFCSPFGCQLYRKILEKDDVMKGFVYWDKDGFSLQ